MICYDCDILLSRWRIGRKPHHLPFFFARRSSKYVWEFDVSWPPFVATKKHIQGKRWNCGVAMAQNWVKITQMDKMWIAASQMSSFPDSIVRI